MKRNLLLLSAAAFALTGLAACNQQTAEDIGPPVVAEADDYGYAPAVEALPPGDPAPVGTYEPDEGYAWAEQAQYLNYAFEDDRPDYVYDYGGVDMWLWEAAGWYLLVEPLLSGDRYYYYRRGEPWPYYVIDDGYGYGYDNGRLVAVYDPAGTLMPASFVTQRADWGGRYLRRGRDLFAARERAPHREVAEARWERRRDRLEAQQERLERAAERQPAWRDYRRRVEAAPPPIRQQLRAERERRREAREDRQEARQDARREDRREDRREARTEERREDRREDRREARREARRDAPAVTPGAAKRDTAPGAAKRNPRADEAHDRNEARKAAREEEKRLRREAREEAKRDR